MSTEQKPKPTGLALMREPFLDHQISKMCRSTKKENEKGRCPKCGGWHGLPAIQLSYVGHAALTDRLLEADPNWNWEPVAVDERGFPYLDKDGGMWIKLTVCGVTRLGYGDSQNQTGGNATKERIGDALRNAAMRFGAALDLWHKGDLHAEEEEQEQEQKKSTKPTKPAMANKQQMDDMAAIVARIKQHLPDADVITLRKLYREGCTEERYREWMEHLQQIDAGVKSITGGNGSEPKKEEELGF